MDHSLIRYLKESLLPEEDLQTVSCPFHLPATSETWECIDNTVSQKVKEYRATSSAVLVRSFELEMWLRFAKQKFRKTPPKARKFHSFRKFMKSKGIAKTTGYKMIKFAAALNHHCKLLWCAVPERFLFHHLECIIYSCKLTPIFLGLFCYVS